MSKGMGVRRGVWGTEERPTYGRGDTMCIKRWVEMCPKSRNVLEGTQPRPRLDGMEEDGKFWRLGIESDAAQSREDS